MTAIIVKYADDSYLLFSTANSELIESELKHVTTPAKKCNLKINQGKMEEKVVRRPNTKLGKDLPIVTTGLTRVGTLKILVVLSEDLCFDTYVNNLCIKARQSMFAICFLVVQRLRLSDVVVATTVAKMLYAAPAWWVLSDKRDAADYRPH